ncbi:MAG: DUF1592 domain-containing protein, partial [Myxococcales bacterium]|nr:DUF1592 domain-containing protein [Myxococcales bacterium]
MRLRLRRHAPLLPLVLAAALAGAQGCVGDIGAGDPGDVDPNRPAACANLDVEVVALPMRRLTGEQWINTVRDLLGDAAFDAPVTTDEGYITEAAVRQLRDASELALSRRANWTAEVFPCDTTGPEDTACFESFLDGFAARAFRRPLTADERGWLTDVYTGARAEGDFAESMDVVLQVVLQSPQVVYLYEGGEAGASEPVRLLSDHELATRLSYFLWNTTPDDTLLAAAGDGLDGAGLRAQAERLLSDARAQATLQRFVSRWLQMDGGKLHHALELATKDDTLYPEFDAELAAAMRTETEAFVQRTFDEGGSFEDLMTGRYAYVNGPLADLYGITDGPTDADTWEWVELDGAERGGLLTRAAFLTVLSTKTVTAPIRRGVWVYQEALCRDLGTPPPNANDVPVNGGEVLDENGNVVERSVREDVTAKTSGDVCAGCHNVINPIGFAFESYDALGRWQTEEVTSGLPVDASGELIGSDVDGAVAGPVELVSKLGQSEQVKSCFAD